MRLLITGCLVLAIAQGAFADYSAVAINGEGTKYAVKDQLNSIAAGANATKSCRQANPNDVCELISLNDKPIITSDQVKARVPKNPHPLYLWQLKSNESTIFIAGSIHILKPGFFPLPPQFEAAFNTSDYLVLEVDTEEMAPTAMQALSMQYAQLPAHTPLSSLLDSDTYQSLGSALEDYGINIDHFERFKPNFVTQQLAVLALLSVGYDPASGLESHFRRKKGGRSILQLESVEFQLDLLFNTPIPTQIDMTAETIKQLPSFEAVTADLVTAWLSGDDGAFLEATEAQSGDTPALRAFNKKLLTDRNYGMTDTITGYLTQPGTYFVLVGAAHLIGDEGIPALLKKRGYAPRRLASNSSISE